MILSVFARFVGPRFALPVAIAVAAILLLGGTFAVGRCTRGNPQAERQAEQTNASAGAVADAAADAIDIIGQRQVNDQIVDESIKEATKGIDNAKTVDAVRNAVLDSVCEQSAHRDDPACKLR